jgi:hypothetical protein
MNELVAVALLVIFGQAEPVAMPSRQACITAQRAIAANGGQAVCAFEMTPDEVKQHSAILVAEMAALAAAREAVEGRWAGTDRAWCMGIRHMGIDPDDPRFWPYEPRCGAEPPYACEGQRTRPGPCPD